MEPRDLRFHKEHEWIRVEGSHATVGISAHAQRELGEIVYVELPKVGQEVKAGGEIAVLESTKAAADIYAPVSGKVTKVNERLQEDVSSLNTSPESTGWLFEVEMENPAEVDELLDQTAYQTLIR